MTRVPACMVVVAPLSIFARRSFTLILNLPATVIRRVTLVTVVVRQIAMAQEWDNAVMHPVRHVLDRRIAHVFHAARDTTCTLRIRLAFHAM